MYTTQQELNTAFYTAYPEHNTSEWTKESGIDWADWFDAQYRAGKVHHSLMEE